MLLNLRFTSVIGIGLLISTTFASANPQDPVKKAELERKKAETKADFERRRAQMKADFEKRQAERKKERPQASAIAKSTPVPNSFDEKSKEFRCPEGKFTVFLPASPRSGNITVVGVTLKMFSFQEREGAYAVAYADLPIPQGESAAQIQDRLNGARDGMLKNIGGKLTGESRIFLQGKHPGREVQASIPSQGGVLRARIYLVGTRLYQVAVIGQPEWAGSKEATKVLGSLALVP